MATGPPHHAGFLLKKGGFRTNWCELIRYICVVLPHQLLTMRMHFCTTRLKRWFVIEDDCVSYYERTEGKSDKRCGSILFSSIQEVRESTFGTSKKSAKQYELELLTTDRTYRFSAESETDRQEWITALGRIAQTTPLTSAAGAKTTISASCVKIHDSKTLQQRLQLMDGFYGEPNEGNWVEEDWHRGRDMDGEALMQQLAEVLKNEQNSLFEDACFPADDSSLYISGKAPIPGKQATLGGSSGRRDRVGEAGFLAGKKIEWKRPDSILDVNAKPVVFSGLIEADDIAQGELGNCYFLAALAACAADQSLIKDLIVEDFAQFGIYGTNTKASFLMHTAFDLT